jgi:NADH-quinone oxidoreductase subunit J
MMGWETFALYALGAWTLVAGLFAVTARKGVHGALAFLSALLGVAGLFALLGAELIAGIQVLVYAGGAAVLFACADGVSGRVSRRLARRAVPGLVAVVLFAGLFMIALRFAGPAFPAVDTGAAAVASRNPEEVGEEIFGRAVLPVEIAGVLLLVAIVGAVLLARERGEGASD